MSLRPTELAPTSLGSGYRVVRRLGEGGMGSVFEVVEESTGRALALKRLGREAQADPRLVRQFEQEFHTLSQLTHPRVVAVFDFERSADAVLYTMELLDGGDLREQSPLPWKRVCALLCDVCSALSLLHSRRMVHRDLTTRNIRLTRDGTAKLIDFGAMAPFGTSKHAVGTPSFTAPEVLTVQTLDARTDLFSLGATAYYALTGRHAFPATSFAALRNVWRSRPVPPSRIVADVPPELDDLVMSLLQLSPVARPGSAAEVMERLSVIGGVALDEQLLVRQAYLSTPTLVGRDEPLLRVRKQLVRALRHRGGSFLVRGVAGSGRSRFLDACVLEGKLMGAVVLRVDAGDAAADWSVARALLAQLRETAPQWRSLPTSLDRVGGPAAEGALPPRGELQAELCHYFVSVARQQCLVVAVDDLHRIDEPSAALVSLLAHAAPAHAAVVVATIVPGAPATAPHALRLLEQAAAPLTLDNLGADDTEKLLLSVFGDVPRVRLLAGRLQSIAAGSPRAVMQLAQHLLDRGVVRYEAGSWTLPHALDGVDLPATLADALRARMHKLSADALRLGRAFALSSKPRLDFGDCLALTQHRDTAKLLHELDELVAADILDTDGDRYGLTQDGWAPILLSELDERETRSLHEALSAVFDADGESFLALQHAYWAGHREDALERLLRLTDGEAQQASEEFISLLASFGNLPDRWREVMEGLLEICLQGQRPPAVELNLRFSIALRATGSVRPCAEHLCVLFERLAQDAGIDLYRDLPADLPPEERLTQTYKMVQERYDATPPRARGLHPLEAIRNLALVAGMAVSLVGRSYDTALLDHVPDLGPFAGLSPWLKIMHWNVGNTVDLLAGRSERAREGYLAVIDYLASNGLDVGARINLASRYAVGVIEASIGIPTALEHADAVCAEPSYILNAWRIRMLHALRQGDFQTAELHKRRLELLRIQNNPPQAFDGSHLWVEVLSYAGAGDLPRIKQILPQIEEMADELSPWTVILHVCRGHYHLLRGDAERAECEFAQGLALSAPGRHQAWAATAGGYLTALFDRGRLEDVVSEGRGLLEAAVQAGLQYQKGFVQRPLALALAALGDVDGAAAHAQAAIAQLEKLGATGLNLGIAYETRAHVALAAGDGAGFEDFARRCAAQYRAGHNPVLTAKYERLLQQARRAGFRLSTELATAGGGGDDEAVDRTLSRIQGLFDTCAGPEERAAAALRCLIEESRSAGGILYTMRQGGPHQAAFECERVAPDNLDALVVDYLSAELEDTQEVTVVSATTEAESVTGLGEVWHGLAGEAFTPLLLSHRMGTGWAVTGLAVLCVVSRREFKNPSHVLPALSAALLDAGDVEGVVGAV